MKKNGYVVFSNDKTAKIRVNRESSCGGNCSHCKGCGTDEIIFEIDNSQKFLEGEVVKVYMEDSIFLKKSLLGYGVLILSVILGAFIGITVFKNELASLFLIVAFLITSLLILKRIYKNKFSDIRVERF